MNDRFFVLIYGTSIKGKDFTHFSSYHNVQDVVDLVRDWLERFCGMDCYTPQEEAALRAANGGELPETAFLCPEVTTPAELARYNGFYNYESLGQFNLFLTPVYDTLTAKQFRVGMNREFGIDKDFSAPAERLWTHLDDFVNSFSDPDLDYTEAEEDIRNFLVRGGFALFNDEAPGRQEIFVIPEGGFAPIDDPTV